MAQELTATDLVALACHTRTLYTDHLNTLNENISIPSNNVTPDAVLKIFDENHFAALKLTRAEMQHAIQHQEELEKITAQYKDSIEGAFKAAEQQQADAESSAEAPSDEKAEDAASGSDKAA